VKVLENEVLPYPIRSALIPKILRKYKVALPPPPLKLRLLIPKDRRVEPEIGIPNKHFTPVLGKCRCST
jgi:hypothetical protein